ncbi:MAG: PcfB family protein [Oscillospiraceae bacterium]|nr:PcfB family protein [Oscillospiraceae bacterium]
MSTGGEAADQMVRMMLSGSEIAIRLSGSALKNMLALTMALAKQNKRLSGKVNMTRMLRETRDLRLFPMTLEQYQAFRRHARKQRLLFSAISDRDGRGRLLDVVMPVTELDRANLIFERIRYSGIPEQGEETAQQEKIREKSREQEPSRDRAWDPERETPKKDTRSGRGSRDTSSRPSTWSSSENGRARTNEKPSVEEQLKGFRAQLDEKHKSVPTVDRGKKRPQKARGGRT